MLVVLQLIFGAWFIVFNRVAFNPDGLNWSLNVGPDNWNKNTLPGTNILLMAEILHQFIGGWSHYL